ncbi:MarR family transcriptional regulator [Tumebacillus sp. BK434]|uniref:MarR family winged helix-turn-helix transcriptional regulator n=1 Tax=Tumebacillus sp. BK434 TaxID=2512169 RepID=UPI001052E75F|nr:MarR family winged helix-turn-helix transcriptional regulator [Tumebacillus sp. BK434]TCP52174.1 MarR family transcriptional regulator [Tumebacillus sp. BK434]
MDYRDYKLEHSIGFKLANTSRLVTNRLNQNFTAKNLPVTHEQWLLMMELWVKDGQTQNALAAATHKDQPSVSRLLDNMIKRNLVMRVAHPNDRRSNLIYLTAEGREMQKGLIGQAQQTISDTTAGIDPDDLTVCMRVLDQIAENLK